MDEENLTPSELDNPEDEAPASLDEDVPVAPDAAAEAEVDEVAASGELDSLEDVESEAESTETVDDEASVAEAPDEVADEVEATGPDEMPVADEDVSEEALIVEADEVVSDDGIVEESLAEDSTSDDISDGNAESEWAPREDEEQSEATAEPEPELAERREFSSVDDFDVSAALAAVASLDQLTAVEDADYDLGPDEEYDFAEQGEYVPVDDYDYPESMPVPAADADYISASYSQGTSIAYPELFVMRRGQIAAVIPALLLIGLGAWLTFVTTTADETAPQIDPMLVLIALVGVLSIGMLSHWWTTHRWARGSFFLSMTLFAVGAVAFYLVRPGDISLTNGWPLLIGGVGVALVLTGLLTQPRSGAMAAFGLMVALLSGAATAVTAALLPADILSLAADAWPVAAVIAVLLLLVPVIRR